ncbi:hypothetical protein J4208_01510 [Candidatus Woesearchaeota archaeon]|nr:hypothetical protein [Candidatus Woesearchaeota archaeon]
MGIIRTFTAITKDDVALAGGKGASLGEMTQAGIPVPQGFVLLSEAFERFIQETNLGAEIDSLLHKVKHEEMHTVERASEQIQALILQSQMPKDIANEVKKHFKTLGAKYVAVRSSATAEDSSTAAWAGQLDSYLNTTEEKLLEHVQRCWASLFTPRAIFYRFEKDLHKTNISVAVVVQKMINSEISGIAFSVHPVTQDYNQLIIEAGFGLGEAIVSGTITPDSYVVEKQPRRILEKNIVEQKRGLYRKEQGGNEWHERIPHGHQQKLSDAQILELTAIVLTIEDHYGFPCDIEWAFEKGKFFITQSRPITTLTEKEKEKKFFFEKEVTRDLALLAIEGFGPALINLYNKLKGIYPTSPFMIFYTRSLLVEEWLDTDLLKEFVELIYLENLKGSIFLEQYIVNYKKHLDFYKDTNITSLKELQKYLSSLYFALESFIIFYFTAGDNRTPKPILQLAKQIRNTDNLGDASDKVVRSALKNIFPHTTGYETVISSNDLPNMPTIDVLKKRAKQFLFIPGKFAETISLQDFSHNHPEYHFHIETPPADSTMLVGQIGNKGLAKGKIRIVNRKKEINNFREGEILVSTMTTPDFLPIMKKAAAFITDEGGITCHAAIISRELKKPCIIGTKFATKILKDGDLVEVDADNGIVRILEKTEDKSLLKYIESQKWGDFKNVRRPLLIASLSNLSARESKKIIAKEDIDVKKFNENSLRAFNLNQPHLSKEILVKELKDPKHIVNYIQEDYTHLAKIVSLIKTISGYMKRKDHAGLHKYTLEFITLYKKIFFMKYYLNGLLQELNEHETKYNFPKKVIVMSNNWRNDWSSIEELYFIKFIAEFLMKRKISGKDFMDYVHIDEFMDLLNKKITGDSLMALLEKRKKSGYILLNLKNKHYQNKLLEFEDATFNSIENILSANYHKVIQAKIKDNCIFGKSVLKNNKKVIGECILIHEKKDLLKHKLDGKILVTPMTTPEFIPYIHNLKGIITDNGGVVCHAAITSREYNIPCIIGTEAATKFLKNGDMVEIDANKGIIRLLEKETNKTIFDPATIDWFKVMERKNLFFVGLAFTDVETEKFKQVCGFQLQRYLFKYEKGMWSTYRGIQEHSELYNYFSQLIKKRDKRLFEFAKQAKKFNDLAKKYIDAYSLNKNVKIDNYEKEYNIYCDTLLYGVTIPWAVLGAFEIMTPTERKVYRDILNLYEPFRAESLYPDFERRILQKYRVALSKRYNLDINLLYLLTPWELKNALKGIFIPKKEILKKRNEYCIYWFNPLTKEIIFSYDPSIEKKITILQKDSVENVKIIKGTIVYPGIVSGNVRIIYEAIDCVNFKQNEILVSPSTNPTLMPAIKKCAGIITDEGGMTSHAAIIARELKKPCIIGTRIATQILKDGMEVEVDADNGIVRILSENSKVDEIKYEKIILSQYMNREHSLFYAHVWNEANRDLFDSFVKGTNIKNMVFVLNKLGILEVYYDLNQLEEVFNKIAQRLIENPKLLEEIISNFYKYWKQLFPYVEKKKKIKNLKELKKYYHNWISWWASMAYLFVIPDRTNIPQNLKKKALKVRVETQQYSDDGDRIFLEFIKEKYPKYFDIAHLITPEEAFRLDSLSTKEVEIIKERKKGCALITLHGKSKLIKSVDLEAEAKKQNISFEIVKQEKTDELRGLAASPGAAKGPVRLVLKKADLALVKKGDIMITYATSPDYVPAMKKCVAVITDEGGVVCHAAIVCRELGLPCIVGTKNATKILKDGDLVEIDADNGIIKILKRTT